MITIIIVRKEHLDEILAKLSSIEKALDRLAAAPSGSSKPAPGTDLMKGFTGNRELCLQLGVNKRTLARYRASGDLTYSLIGGKVFYSEEDIQRLMTIFRNRKRNIN